jgi:hypothetical protein
MAKMADIALFGVRARKIYNIMSARDASPLFTVRQTPFEEFLLLFIKFTVYSPAPLLSTFRSLKTRLLHPYPHTGC